MGEVRVECSGCSAVAVLPPTEGRPGFVDIAPMEGWTAPPILCPTCSRTKPIPCADAASGRSGDS